MRVLVSESREPELREVPTIAKGMPADWTFADAATAGVDVCGPRYLSPPIRGFTCHIARSENVQCAPAGSAIIGPQRIREGYESRLAGMFASPAITRRTLRRQVFYRRSRQRSVLPLDLSRAHGEGKKCPLFSNRRGRSRSRLSSLSALPAGKLARNSSVAGNFKHCFSSLALDR